MDNEERFFYEYIVTSKAIGDFIAFESFLTDKEKINLKEVMTEWFIVIDCKSIRLYLS